MSDVRFIIITVPPPALSVLLESARAAAASLTRTCAALAYPPHVTLRTGALVPEESVESFAAGLRESLGAWRPFTINARGFFHAQRIPPGTASSFTWWPGGSRRTRRSWTFIRDLSPTPRIDDGPSRCSNRT